MPDEAAFVPLVEELLPPPDPDQSFLRLADLPHVLFLDSARRNPVLGRYSFVTADPFDWMRREADSSGSLELLAASLNRYSAATLADLPPFQGGAAGLFSYDLGRELERLPRPVQDDFQSPALAIGLYDVVVAFDHAAGRAWIISQGLPETEPRARTDRAQQRLRQFREILRAPATPPCPSDDQYPPLATPPASFDIRHAPGRISFPSLSSNFTPDGYLAAVRRAIEYVHAGDIFQVNLSQRLLCRAEDSSLELYRRLRQRNPATFAAYFDLGDQQIVSASPERFLQVRKRQIEARPIKGTRRRGSQPEADLFSGDELRESEKDRAENVMIVDLLRNDLSRVCLPDSVRVTQLCRVEIYEYVQHLVSSVMGELRPGCTAIDALAVAFPGGSITGAPKVRAMEIIAELEPTARGPYCGSLAYLGFDGACDSSILIRTITAARGWWQFPVGGGIVAQSNPLREYEETWHKAEGLLRSLRA
ncbi:MAG: anthranilate synthase component I family protein [Pirellulales bacterium]